MKIKKIKSLVSILSITAISTPFFIACSNNNAAVENKEIKLNNLVFKELTTDSVNIEFSLANFDLKATEISKLSFKLNNKLYSFENIKIFNNLVYQKVADLNQNTEYSLSELKINGKAIAINPEISRSFKTLTEDLSTVNKIEYNELSYDKVNVKVYLNATTNEEDIKLKLNKRYYKVISNNGSVLSFYLFDLSPDTEYTIEELLIKDKPISLGLANKTFRTHPAPSVDYVSVKSFYLTEASDINIAKLHFVLRDEENEMVGSETELVYYDKQEPNIEFKVVAKVILENDESHIYFDLNKNFKTNHNYAVKSLKSLKAETTLRSKLSPNKVIYESSNGYEFGNELKIIAANYNSISKSINLKFKKTNLNLASKTLNLSFKNLSDTVSKAFILNSNDIEANDLVLKWASTYKIADPIINNKPLDNFNPNNIEIIVPQDTRKVEVGSFRVAKISPNSATLKVVLDDPDHLITKDTRFIALVGSESHVGALSQDSNSWELTFNLNNLNEKTSYSLMPISYSFESEQRSVQNSQNLDLSFMTQAQQTSLSSISLSNNSITLPENSITVFFSVDQLLDNEVSQKARVSFVKEKDKSVVNSQEITLEKDKFSYEATFSNLTEGLYTLSKVEVFKNGNWTEINKGNFKTVFNVEAEKVADNTGIPFSPENADEHVNIFKLQNANKIIQTEENVQTYTEQALSESALSSKANYTSYFAIKNAKPQKDQSSDKESTSNLLKDQILINTIAVQNDAVNITLNNTTNKSITSARVLVKGWDHLSPWTKWISTSVSSNNLSFNTSQLTKYQSKFVITQLEINNHDRVDYDIASNYIFDVTMPNLNNLNISNFEVFKDEANKKLYGSLSLNWTSEQLQNLWDKVFVLKFDVDKQVFVPKTDIFGGTSNEEQKFDLAHTIQPYKKIYVNFDDLAKFSMDGFQEKIRYTLSSIDIVSPNSFINLIPRIDTKTQNKSFVYSLNWANENIQLRNLLQTNTQDNSVNSNLASDKLDITKKDLYAIANNSKPASSSRRPKKSQTQPDTKNLIKYSLNNFNTLLDYNFNRYNQQLRYKNVKEDDKAPTKEFKLIKNNVVQKMHWFQPSEILANTLFKIYENKSKATITKDLSSIVGLNESNYDDTIIWLTFELDLNPRTPQDWTEFNDIVSRIRIPVGLSKLKEKSKIEDVDFMFDYFAQDSTYQQELFNKIKSNIRFDLSLTNNQLQLDLKTRNNDISFNNEVWFHNNSSKRSAFINVATMFVNWVQPETETQKRLSFKETRKVDALSIQGHQTGYNDTYEIKTLAPSQDTYRNEQLLDPKTPADETRTRLYLENESKGIEEARKRLFSMWAQSDGTWNIIGKINNDSNDYRFYTVANYHVWDTNRSEKSGIADKSQSAYGREVLKNKIIELVTSTPLNKNEIANPISPIYKYAPETEGGKEREKTIPLLGNIFEFNPKGNPIEDENKIHFEMFSDFSSSLENPFGKQYDNMGEVVEIEKNENAEKQKEINREKIIDMVVAIVDLKPIFNKFQNVDLDTYVHNGKKLEQREKNAIKRFLDFKNLKPLKQSDLGKYINTYSNLNFYMGSIPKDKVPVNPESTYEARYREYLYGYNGFKVVRSPQGGVVYASRPSIKLEAQNIDLYSGSSSSGTYDHEGKLIGIDTNGNLNTFSNFVIADTQRFSFMGTETNIYNPNTFYNKVKKVSYLYPNKYSDIYKEEKQK
ncbi:hypothetical protein [Mycoplasma procyoni]|uniref:hypothetical protein n=1 Tax=Mycoplasma procyoni TaxID=568784 RepID=UPI00197BEC1A|nr:hypothetical protein [Mycoplasma procyoni]MBN3534613.1 hypothetical protein [Mycoplasma procyoni]